MNDDTSFFFYLTLDMFCMFSYSSHTFKLKYVFISVSAGIFKKSFTSLSHIEPVVLYPIPDFSVFDQPVEPPSEDLLPQNVKTLFLSINRYERKKNIPLAIQALGKFLLWFRKAVYATFIHNVLYFYKCNLYSVSLLKKQKTLLYFVVYPTIYLGHIVSRVTPPTPPSKMVFPLDNSSRPLTLLTFVIYRIS